MPTSELSSRLTRAKIALYRDELSKKRRSLRFPQPLESEFRRYLQSSQFTSVCILLAVGLVIWACFAALDIARYPSSDNPALRQAYPLNVFFPRWSVLAIGLLLGVLLLTRRLNAHSPTFTWGKYIFLYLVGTASITTGNFFAAHDIVTARNATVILVMMCFFPLGMVIRHTFWLGLALCLTNMLAGYWMLPQHLMQEHWMLSGIIWVTLIVAAVSGALRELATREQYLLRQLLEWEVRHDPLTDMANRRYFEEWAAISLRQAQRDGKPLAMAVVDIDHFKQYNDNYGHHQGDRALQEVATCLQTFANRPLDLAVRLGGEEFAIVGYGETAQSLKQRLEQFQHVLQMASIEHAHSPTSPQMTTSIGISECLKGASFEALYQRADRALYLAKTSGRNRIVLSEESRPAKPTPKVQPSAYTQPQTRASVPSTEHMGF